MLPAILDYVAPKTVHEAVRALASQPNSMVLAGTYREVIDLKMRRISPSILVDLRKISELRGITTDRSGIRIGSMTTLNEIMNDKSVQSSFAALAEAAAASGDPQERNMDSIGGSITYNAANSDAAAAILALGGTVNVAGASGERPVLATDFFRAGAARDQIVTSIALASSSAVSAYERFKNPATLAAVCGVAVSLTPSATSTVEKCAFAVTGATARPTRLAKAEAALQGQPLNQQTIERAAAVAEDGLELVSDVQFSGEYRGHLVQVLLKRALSRFI